ncbi:MAG: ABC transporter ATP-binding protein [Hyphomicrobiaceae bacterium]
MTLAGDTKMQAVVDTELLISLDHVDKKFGDHYAVRDLSFSVARGEIVALLGRTGAGKSTALHLIMGVMAPSAGRVRVDGLDPYRDFKKLRGKLAVSFQTDRLLPWRTAVENVELGLQILGVGEAERRRRSVEWLANVKIVGEENLRKYPPELSGGMRQRTSLARALAVDPSLLLLDESFSQLDHVTSKALRADVADLVRRHRKTCVLITHRIDDALEMADRVLVLTAPAAVALDLRITPADRADPDWLERQHDAVARAMGGGGDSSEDAVAPS